MAHDTYGFAVLGTAAGVDVALTPVPDNHGAINGNFITIGDNDKLIGAAGCFGAACTRAFLVAPSLRTINPLHIKPFALGILFSATPEYDVHPSSPIPLEKNEGISMVHLDGAATEHVGIIHLTDAPQEPVTGDIRTVRFTITLAQVLHAWATSPITFIDVLENGDYDIVGAGIVMAAGVAFRFVFNKGGNRPGGITQLTAASIVPRDQRYGRMGVWGTFNNIFPPNVETLSTAAVGSATYEGFMDVIRK